MANQKKGNNIINRPEKEVKSWLVSCSIAFGYFCINDDISSDIETDKCFSLYLDSIMLVFALVSPAQRTCFSFFHDSRITIVLYNHIFDYIQLF